MILFQPARQDTTTLQYEVTLISCSEERGRGYFIVLDSLADMRENPCFAIKQQAAIFLGNKPKTNSEKKKKNSKMINVNLPF